MPKKRMLIIRFSAFGDLCQSLFSAEQLKDTFQIEYVTRSDFHSFLEEFQDIKKVYSLERKNGLAGLMKLAFQLRRENFDLVYDAHSNLRSHILAFILCFLSPSQLVRRSKQRFKFFILFKFRKNLLPNPFRGGQSYIDPIDHLVDSSQKTTALEYNVGPILDEAAAFKPYTLLSPFASWPQKLVPAEKWLEFFRLHPDKRFIIVGGPDDKLPDEVIKNHSHQILDLTGRAKWVPTLHLVHEAESVIGVDTGVTHIGDLIGKTSSFLIGPSAIGYPTRSTSQTIEVDLACKPCSKDGRIPCSNKVKMECMKLLPMSEVNI